MANHDLLIHAGPHKTGSTSIQYWLSSNREWLLEHGVLYPVAGRVDEDGQFTTSHKPFFHAARLNRMSWFNNQSRKLLEEIEMYKPHMVVLSSEVISRENLCKDFFDKINKTFTGNRRSILIYVRRQDELLLSRYSQRVKSGKLRWPKTIHQLNQPRFLDHRHRIERLSRMLPEFNIIVRSYNLDKYNLIGSFAEAIGIDIGSNKNHIYINKRPDWGNIKIRRYINALPNIIHDPALRILKYMDRSMRNNGIHIFSHVSPPLSLDQQKKIYSQYMRSNKWLSCNYFNGCDPFPRE